MALDFTKLPERLLREGASYRAMFACILSCYAESHGKPRCVEKPLSTLFSPKRSLEWFRDALVLHIVRDPRDVVSSLSHRPSAASSVVANAKAWLNLNLAAHRSSHQPGYLEIRYETLIAQPETELKRICQFIGEEYSPSMLLPKQQQVEDGAGMDRFLTPLTASRVGVWRQELTAREAAQIEWGWEIEWKLSDTRAR
jgi:hypothetical protein